MLDSNGVALTQARFTTLLKECCGPNEIVGIWSKFKLDSISNYIDETVGDSDMA